MFVILDLNGCACYPGEAESHVAFLKHMSEQFSVWGKVVAISLAETSGKEQVVGDAYLSHVLALNSPDLTYVTFDFHEYWCGVHFVPSFVSVVFC